MGVLWEACMRVFSRIALTLLAVLVLAAPTALAQLDAGCPMRLVASNPALSTGPFFQSPHGAFRSGNQFFVLRGSVLTTFNVTDLGDLQDARDDQIGTLGARESRGGVVFGNGLLFVSSEAGLEIFDLSNVRPGGSAPVLLSRTPGLHYRRLAVSGTTLAGLFPATDLPCFAGGPTPNCFTTVDLFNVSNASNPIRVGTITSQGNLLGGFNDIAFNFGFLVVTANNGTNVFNVANPASPSFLSSTATPGTFLVSNGTNLLGVGNDTSILTFTVGAPGSGGGFLTPMFFHTLATLRPEHANPIMFHPQATFDEQGGRLITMVDELDPQTLQPARTFAFDVFDFAAQMFEGKDPRQFEQVSFTQSDEVKFNPLAVGPMVFVVGEISGVQQWGACGQMAGRIELESTAALPCPTTTGGPTTAEIHGWVTGATKIANVELFLDSGSLGPANLTGAPRTDIASTTPVQPWRIGVTLDATLRGDHVLRAVGTDINGNRRQFASQRLFFASTWQQNCAARRRAIR
jgi:hypothetical protein